MKKELTKEEEIAEVLKDLSLAMYAKVEAEEKYLEASAEQRKAHYEVVKARQRLDTLGL